MKAIMISIKPKYVADILNGRKTLEIRKNMPKCDLPIDVYIYCTKDKTELYYSDKGCVLTDFGIGSYYKNAKLLNGKVVAKFTLNKVEETFNQKMNDDEMDNLLKESCLIYEELWAYCENRIFYMWHIDNLEIFDKPKYINEFYEYTNKKIVWYSGCPKVKVISSLTKAPRSWCYVEVTE